MSGDVMAFPNTWEEYEEDYGFTDTEQIYTNGSRLIPSFRVKQWLEHIEVSEDCISRTDLPKELNGVVLADCEKIVTEFLVEHECDEIWHTVRALRDFYDWTMDAPSVVPSKGSDERMKRAKAEKIRKGIEDKIRCNTVDMEEWAKFWGFTEDEYDEFLDMAIETLGQKSKHGKWIVDRYCSECEWDKQEAGYTSGWRENYCPNCGARME